MNPIDEQLTGREPHPVIPVLPPEEEARLAALAPDKVAEFYALRREALLLEQEDPFRFGYEPAIWHFVDDVLCDGKIVKLVDHRGILPADFKEAEGKQLEIIGTREALVGGANRATKSHYGAKKCLKVELAIPEARGWSFHESGPESIARQQPLFWYYMPPEYKNQQTGRFRQGPITNIGYSQKNGFADGTFVLPNKSQHWFKNYEQDVGKLEGEKLDVAWLDENAPVPFLKTIRFRVLDKKGLIIVTFTPIDDGFTAVFNEYDTGSTTIVEVEAPLLPIRKPKLPVPVLADADTPGEMSGEARESTGDDQETAGRTATMDSRGGHNTLSGGPHAAALSLDSSTRDPCTGEQPISPAQKFANTESKRLATSPSEGKGAETPEGPGRDGNKPLMRNRVHDETLPDRHADGDTLSGGVESRHAPNVRIRTSQPTRSGSSAPPAQNLLPVPVLAEPRDDATPISLPLVGEARQAPNECRGGQNTLSGSVESRHALQEKGCCRGEIQRTNERSSGSSAPPAQKFEIVGYRKVPRVKRAGPGSDGNVKANMVFFHITDNPYFDKQTLYEQLEGANEEMILARAYGIAVRAALNQFKFKDTVHVISLNRFGEMVKANPNGTRFHLVDPCSGRNWFMIWTYHPAPKKIVIYREWPSYGHLGAYIPGIGDPGPWAMPGKAADGERGPAQRPFKFGLDRYKTEIERVETVGKEREPIFERWMDSRYGNASKQEREGTTTLIEQMHEIEMDFVAMTGEKNILGANDGSIDMINRALDYDEKVAVGEYSPELARLNEPNLLVTENCPNVVYALQNWTGRDGQHGACKDPVDVLRGLFLSELDYLDPAELIPQTPWMSRRR